MKTKIIAKKDYNKVFNNLMGVRNQDKFQGYLFIYDDNFKEDFEEQYFFSLEDWMNEYYEDYMENINAVIIKNIPKE